jgi:hypothetical protein
MIRFARGRCNIPSRDIARALSVQTKFDAQFFKRVEQLQRRRFIAVTRLP